ncbi:uncharacterized protein LOC126374939 isoform X2 [Pectinophora gossypiella]|uniref:Aftiphilin clathrin-binding box domain-containing protein n=1 Tax=Pectinophora gossypiella TaxID=13191 RepID=A0A1E1WIX3_PECGO|nr:uncharacterized protein LOC126374939 isoform X2 [Pectinophora gossypiella]
MSIPPLVCSTPPPPDQCEDDKDPEDFDIQYNLSQDDDDDNYDYGNFATFNHFTSNSKPEVPVIAKVVENVKVDDISKTNTNSIENILGTNISSNIKLSVEEETNVEDLDLKIDEESLKTIDVLESKDICVENNQSSEPGEEINIPRDTKSYPAESNEFMIEPPSLDHVEEPPSQVDEIITEDVPVIKPESEEQSHETENEIKPETIEETKLEELEGRTKQLTVDDDNFGDFDDFKFTNPAEKPPTLDICDNPWDNTETTEDDFGDFKANFDSNESSLFSTEVKPEHSKQNIENKVEDSEINDDDGFGDFNDFQSSSAESRVNIEDGESLESQTPVLFLEITDDEDKLMEHINREINNMFEDELPEVEEEFEGKLETQLGVTWGHLLETEVRQPYMVNWNNSVGQKTLLKALCIDSRNILFGPKWSYNMPKYAANLGMAPLQPVKQVAAPSTSQIEGSSADKSTCKAATWSDPFTSDGQQSRNSETATANPAKDARPADLDVFEASTSSKSDKIFSSTLNVQPIRQISLPDTHIFTPTDSETPRSTTIHYDTSPTVLLPQTLIEPNKSDAAFKSDPNTLPPQSSSKASAVDDEYWEFQDFKGTLNSTTPSATSLAPEKSEAPKTSLNVTHGTQLLQPIKLEPTIPTLNWPDPGQVKETFDDFSDFVSTASLNSQTQSPDVPVTQIASKSVIDYDKPGPSGIVPNVKTASDISDNFEDDFDTFQSALPSTSSINFNFVPVNSKSTATAKPATSPQMAPQTMTDFGYALPKIDNVKSDTISYESIKPQDNLVQNQMSLFPENIETNKTPEFPVMISPQQTTSPSMLGASLLQPTSVASSVTQSQKKSAQILQPLTLESFSQINWPNPGIDLQDLSRFNPVETLHSLKTDLSVNSQSKVSSPVSSHKNVGSSQVAEDDWGDFVSSKPKPQQAMPKKQTTFVDDDEWTDFVSSPSVKPQNGLNTISLNVHTNLSIQKSSKYTGKGNKPPIDIPSLNYITPKSSNHKSYKDRHFQNL